MPGCRSIDFAEPASSPCRSSITSEKPAIPIDAPSAPSVEPSFQTSSRLSAQDELVWSADQAAAPNKSGALRNDETEEPTSEVMLNVYLLPDGGGMKEALSIGAYHSGVQIGDCEFAYGAHKRAGETWTLLYGADTAEWVAGETGVWEQAPRHAFGFTFKKAVHMGSFRGTAHDAFDILHTMKRDWLGTEYDLLERNCNHFSSAVTMRLVNRSVPDWVNRLAGLGESLTSIFGRPAFLGGAPDAVQAQQHVDLQGVLLEGQLGLQGSDSQFSLHWCLLSDQSIHVMPSAHKDASEEPEFCMAIEGVEALHDGPFLIHSGDHEIVFQTSSISDSLRWIDACKAASARWLRSAAAVGGGESEEPPEYYEACDHCAGGAPELPAGWIECFDEESDLVYYYDEETGEEQQQHPGMVPPEAAQAQAPEAAQAQAPEATQAQAPEAAQATGHRRDEMRETLRLPNMPGMSDGDSCMATVLSTECGAQESPQWRCGSCGHLPNPQCCIACVVCGAPRCSTEAITFGAPAAAKSRRETMHTPPDKAPDFRAENRAAPISREKMQQLLDTDLFRVSGESAMLHQSNNTSVSGESAMLHQSNNACRFTQAEMALVSLVMPGRPTRHTHRVAIDL